VKGTKKPLSEMRSGWRKMKAEAVGQVAGPESGGGLPSISKGGVRLVGLSRTCQELPLANLLLIRA